jgi:tetratricopeptide (TPR) repeat protein
VWRAGFIWDDDDHLTANPAMTAPHGLRMIWSSLAISRYYPLTLTSFWVQRHVWGLDPMPYHLVNIAIHAVNALLVFLVLRRLRVPGAMLAALVWLLHPVNVESVAWVTELKNTQSGLFFLFAILFFLRFDAQGRRRWYALALLCGAAAMLSKPSTVILPLTLLLCVWWERGRWRWMDVARIGPFFGMALSMSVVTVLEQRGHVLRTGTTEWKLGIAKRLIIAGKAIWFYAAKLLWPFPLTFVYQHWNVATESLLSWMPLSGLMALGILLWIWRRRHLARAALFGLGFFVTALLPVLGFFDVYYFRYSFVADHFQYLAGVGPIALLISGGIAICQRGERLGRCVGGVAVAVLLMMLGWVTSRQAGIYRDEETLWRDTIAKNPQCWLGYNNLGIALVRGGKVPEAIGDYEQALRIKPDYARAYNNLGAALMGQGRLPEAIGDYERAVRIQPDYAEARNNLGAALMGQGRLTEAVEECEQAVRIQPDYAEAHNNLGAALQKEGRLQDAIAHWEQALRIQPDYANAHYNLGNALVQAGRVPEAIGHYEQAERIKPDFPEMHNSLGLALVRMGKARDAILHYEAALRIKPDYAEAHYNLGVAFAKVGQLRDAMAHWEQAVRIRPDFFEPQFNLAVAWEQLGKPQEAIRRYEEASRIKPEFAAAQSNLAWLLATLPPSEGGDGVRAVALAERACQLTDNRAAVSLDTLAAAYAATGRFDEAVATAQKALELARTANQPNLARDIEARLELYRSGRAYSQSTGVTSPTNP